MSDLQMEPPDESEQTSSSEKILLRIGATFLCVMFGFVLVLIGYLCAITFDFNLSVFVENTGTCLFVCLAIWIMIGLLTPFYLFQRFFERLSGITVEKIIVFVVVFGTLVILHWYVVTLATELLISIFGAE
jgi:hypothetical protein